MPTTAPTGIPTWAYVFGSLLLLVGTTCAAILVFRGTRMSVNQQGYQDLSAKHAALLSQLQSQFDALTDRFDKYREKTDSRLGKLVHYADVARRYIFQQDAWIIRVYDPSVHTVPPPEIPDELKEIQ